EAADVAAFVQVFHVGGAEGGQESLLVLGQVVRQRLDGGGGDRLSTWCGRAVDRGVGGADGGGDRVDAGAGADQVQGRSQDHHCVPGGDGDACVPGLGGGWGVQGLPLVS